MLAVLVAAALLLVSVIGIYLLLKSMGQDGVEAAAPGSCRSGRCGVQSPRSTGDDASLAQEQYVQVDEIRRKEVLPNSPPH